VLTNPAGFLAVNKNNLPGKKYWCARRVMGRLLAPYCPLYLAACRYRVSSGFSLLSMAAYDGK